MIRQGDVKIVMTSGEELKFRVKTWGANPIGGIDMVLPNGTVVIISNHAFKQYTWVPDDPIPQD